MLISNVQARMLILVPEAAAGLCYLLGVFSSLPFISLRALNKTSVQTIVNLHILYY